MDPVQLFNSVQTHRSEPLRGREGLRMVVRSTGWCQSTRMTSTPRRGSIAYNEANPENKSDFFMVVLGVVPNFLPEMLPRYSQI